MQNRIEYLPTPAEIVAGCARVQQSWSARERRRRRVNQSEADDQPMVWLPPIVDTSAIRQAGSQRASVSMI